MIFDISNIKQISLITPIFTHLVFNYYLITWIQIKIDSRFSHLFTPLVFVIVVKITIRIIKVQISPTDFFFRNPTLTSMIDATCNSFWQSKSPIFYVCWFNQFRKVSYFKRIELTGLFGTIFQNFNQNPFLYRSSELYDSFMTLFSQKSLKPWISISEKFVHNVKISGIVSKIIKKVHFDIEFVAMNKSFHELYAVSKLNKRLSCNPSLFYPHLPILLIIRRRNSWWSRTSYLKLR